MKAVAAVAVLLSGVAAQTPLSKVTTLLGNLRAKVVAEGEASVKTFGELKSWCALRQQEISYSIKTNKGQIGEDEAIITEAVGNQKVFSGRAGDLTAAISKNEADMKAASAVRGNETAAFKGQEAELVNMASVLQRAISVLRTQGKKGDALLQKKTSQELTHAIALMLDSSLVNSADARTLSSLMQKSDDFLAIPQKSGKIVSVLEDLLTKATENLDAIRKDEQKTHHNYLLMKQSLEDEVKFANKDLSEVKKNIATASERESKARGALEADTRNLKEDEKALSSVKADCQRKTEDYNDETRDRTDEIAAIDKAVAVLAQQTGGAASVAYKAAAFLQLESNSKITSSADLVKFEAVRYVRDLAKKQHSEALTQLAARMSAAMHISATGKGDQFDNVKNMIKSMIAKLDSEDKADSTAKDFCDKEMRKSNSSQADKSTELNKLTTKVDSAKSASATLKQEVSSITNQLAELAKSQAALDKMRAEEKANYDQALPQLENGIQGVQTAISVLRDYYSKTGAKKASSGSATGVVGLLEVVLSDFTKSLAELKVKEDDARKSYSKQTEQNKIEKATKGEDIKYKTKEAGELDVAVTQLLSDSVTVKTELDSVNEYLEKLKAQCIKKETPYDERQKRRQAEIEGLKNALTILSAQSFVQTSQSLRGAKLHVQA